MGDANAMTDPTAPGLPPAPATRRLVLASTSPYRRELLGRLGLPFETAAPQVDESPRPGETPRALALRLSTAKAEAVCALHPDAVVIGSDQTATIDGLGLIGKPGTHLRAVEQLRRASGRCLHFHTGVALLCAATGFRRTEVVETRVRFRRLDDAAIEAYLAREPAYDCAGSAKVEGLGIALLESVEGPDPTALVGLPLIALTGLLAAAGLPVLGGHRAATGARP
jgi:septum formation protein